MAKRLYDDLTFVAVLRHVILAIGAIGKGFNELKADDPLLEVFDQTLNGLLGLLAVVGHIEPIREAVYEDGRDGMKSDLVTIRPPSSDPICLPATD